MAKLLRVWVLLGNILFCICQDYDVQANLGQEESGENPSYSFGYGVSDTQTGDIKTVWEEKQGDTVKGHYSVIEPDGSMRTVEYSAGPNTGFTATVNHEDKQNEPDNPLSNPDFMEDKALRDYDRYYDFSEDADLEPPYKSEKKRKRYPYDNPYNDYSPGKRQKYPSDLEQSEYTHNINIKHPHDDSYDGPAHSHMSYSTDPNCNKKHKPDGYYGNIADLDFRKQKYPPIPDAVKYDGEKYKSEASSIDSEKYINSYKYNSFKPIKPDDYNDPQPKYGYPNFHDIPPPESTYSDYIPPRPKKKYRPPIRAPEPFDPENLDDYVLVPKRKLKKPPRYDDYQPEPEEDFDQRIPYTSYDDEFEDDRYAKPFRGPTGSQKEEKVVKKIVKKKPIINILDIFDI
ncbi:unnamed protein product [Leptosia nina]|uniref:Uncharacterized protein n=1 Tax=Leptosia nina TaxID=320188 RepID=A0AAV1JWA7_9NEOP